MAADLGAPRTREGRELLYVRQRLLVECVAAGARSIDCPYTFPAMKGVEADAHLSRSLGYTAKSAVRVEHIDTINRAMTPSTDEVMRSQAIISAFEAARQRGEERAEVDGVWVEMPFYLNAQRLVVRARALGIA